MYDLIIIGGGPAGITAGIYAARQKLNTLLITREFGGQVARALSVENYPGFEAIPGRELIKIMEKHLRKFKIDIEEDEVAEVEKNGDNFLVMTKNKKKFEAKAVIVTSGADPRPLKVPGEKEFLGRGVSYCAVCDGAFFPNKTVAVVGGGNSGFEAAIFLSKIAKKIYILEYTEKVKADQTNQEIVRNLNNVEIITNASLKEIRGEKFVREISYQDRKTGQEKILEVEGVFVEIGSQPAVSFLKDLVDFNEKHEIIVDPENNMTKTPGLFAAGDVTAIKLKQIVLAAGEGCKASLSAYSYLRGLNNPVRQYH